MKMNEEMNERELIGRAQAARAEAYCPYSGVAVGAALVGESREVYLGANVENASYGATLCAERAAFAAAVSHGERHFKKLAIAGGAWGKATERPFYPCGLCLQVMAEFCEGDFEIIIACGSGYEKYTLAQLLPKGFTRELLD